MLTTYEKFRLQDEDKKNDFFLEVNWEENNEKINECKIIKVIFPNGDVSFIKREYLNSMLFMFGTEDDQRKMIPQTLETVHWRKTVLGVRANKDIHKGEMINFPLEISFPCKFTQQIIGEVKHQRKKALGTSPHLTDNKILIK